LLPASTVLNTDASTLQICAATVLGVNSNVVAAIVNPSGSLSAFAVLTTVKPRVVGVLASLVAHEISIRCSMPQGTSHSTYCCHLLDDSDRNGTANRTTMGPLTLISTSIPARGTAQPPSTVTISSEVLESGTKEAKSLHAAVGAATGVVAGLILLFVLMFFIRKDSRTRSDAPLSHPRDPRSGNNGEIDDQKQSVDSGGNPRRKSVSYVNPAYSTVSLTNPTGRTTPLYPHLTAGNGHTMGDLEGGYLAIGEDENEESATGYIQVGNPLFKPSSPPPSAGSAHPSGQFIPPDENLEDYE
jgi:hypothetical protein